MLSGFELFLTYAASVLAAICLAFVGYLAWRQFGPRRKRRRRHRRRTHRSAEPSNRR